MIETIALIVAVTALILKFFKKIDAYMLNKVFLIFSVIMFINADSTFWKAFHFIAIIGFTYYIIQLRRLKKKMEARSVRKINYEIMDIVTKPKTDEDV